MSGPDSDSLPEQQIAELLVKHDRAVLRYIMTFVPRRDDAEEILQRTAIVLWEKFADYDQSRPFLPWAYRFAYFEVLNFRKQIARDRLIFSEDVLASLEETRKSWEPMLEARRDALKVCITQLRAEDLDLLRQRYCDSVSIASLAEVVGRTAKSLYRRLDRIRDLLTRCVDRRLASEMTS